MSHQSYPLKGAERGRKKHVKQPKCQTKIRSLCLMDFNLENRFEFVF